MGQHRILPMILSGGSGSRLWPLSREALPKQLLALHGPRTMIQNTVLRTTLPGAEAPTLICNEGHRFLVAEQMQDIGVSPRAIILEPVARNTAPAAVIAALSAAETDPQSIVLLLPSDHIILNEAAFGEAASAAATAAAQGHIVTFGIQPKRAETGYGYIERGAALKGAPGAFAVKAFREKPDAQTAQRFVSQGDHLWNSGMFVFRADIFLEEVQQLAPAVLDAARDAFTRAKRDLDFIRLDADAFASSPSISVDHAVMEHTSRAAVVPCELGWSDVGAWSALWDIEPHDAQGNVFRGDVMAHDVTNSFVHGDARLTALIGVKDLTVVITDDAVLIADRGRAQDVKLMVERLKKGGRPEYSAHRKVFRPWGSYDSIDAGERFQVKEIVVKPGARLSMQMHHHRAEHWIVVQGTARVTRGDDVFVLHENESTFIPTGTKHRLENPGKIALRLIEVQTGSYLGEDDIVRFDDVYGRS